MNVEHVLVVRTLLFHEVGHFQGFHGDVEPYLNTLLRPSSFQYLPRNEMESDPSYKQLIPYCIFVHNNSIFQYTRGTQQGEKRLHAKRSIGVGGHISSIDHETGESPYREGLKRELSEEVEILTPYRERLAGLINDDETEVGKVHLGVVHLIEVEAPKVFPREQSMINAGFTQMEELIRDRDQFETWSQICIDQLIKVQLLDR